MKRKVVFHSEEITRAQRIIFGSGVTVILFLICSAIAYVVSTNEVTGTGTLRIPTPYGSKSWVSIESNEPYDIYTLGPSSHAIRETAGTMSVLRAYGRNASGAYESQHLSFDKPTSWTPYEGREEYSIEVVSHGERPVRISTFDATTAYVLMAFWVILTFIVWWYALEERAVLVELVFSRSRRSYMEIKR